MTDQKWTRLALEEVVANGLVSGRDRSGAAVDPPEWLRARALGHQSLDSAESISVVHSEDRGKLIAHFLDALNSPGRAVSTTFRAQYDSTWRLAESTAINLVHDQDVGCIIFVTREVVGMTIDDANHATEGDQAANNWMLLTLTESGVIAAVEGNVIAMIGYGVDEIVGRMPTEFVPSESLAEVVRLWLELNEHPDVTRVGRHRFLRKDGSDIWIESSYVHRGIDSPSDNRVLVVMWDITQRRAAEAALRNMAADFRMLADEVPAAVFRCESDGKVTFHNSRWDELFGEGRQIARIQDLLDAESGARLDDLLASGSEVDPSQRSTIDLAGTDGRTWRLTLRPLSSSGTERREFIGSLFDNTLNVQLQRHATYDPVTGLLNRAAIEAVIAAILADDDPDAVVLFVDLDRFKAVNDDFGHDAGDVVLEAVASRLAGVVRSGDSVGRWGGDEFVVVLTNTGADDATLVARLGHVLAEPVHFGRGAWDAAASIGAARCMKGDDVDTVVNRADQAMLEIKRARHGGEVTR